MRADVLHAHNVLAHVPEPIDFVGTDYAVGWRGAEETLLPLALERKIGFMAYFPFDRARFFNRAKEMPLPAWAAEFERLRSWLGLSEWQPESVEQWNARPRSPMSPELQERLTRYFEPYDARLAEQMGRTPSWRSS